MKVASQGHWTDGSLGSQIDQRVCSVTDSRNLSCESKAWLQVLDLGLASSSRLLFVSLQYVDTVSTPLQSMRLVLVHRPGCIIYIQFNLAFRS